MEEREIKALISLLDDQDVQVSEHVENTIRLLGKSAIPFLEQAWESCLDPSVQRRIENLVHELQTVALRERLTEWYGSEDRELLTGMWIVATIQYPDLELEKVRQSVEQLYFEVWPEIPADATPQDRIRTVNNFLFTKLRFGANTRNFHSPGNSMINIVMDTRRGNPITLCVIYMLVARKLKLPVFGVNLPNMFMLLYRDGSNEFYINAFNRGLVFTRKDLETYIQELHLNPRKEFFEPCSNEDIIRRALRNLIVAFDKIGEHARAEEVKELLLLILDGGDLNITE